MDVRVNEIKYENNTWYISDKYLLDFQFRKCIYKHKAFSITLELFLLSLSDPSTGK